MTNDINIFDSPRLLAEGFAEEFASIIKEYSTKNTILNAALSGGNTPKLFFQTLADNYKNKIDWNYVHLYWVDERCVPPDDNDSNFGMTKKYLFDKIGINEANIHRICGEEDSEAEAERYSALVYSNLPRSNTLPRFDLVLLGIGSDGHTASIFPDQMNLLDTDKLYSTSVHPESQQVRITMTGRVINNAKRIYFLVSGKDKAGVISDILGDEKKVFYPVSFIKPVEGFLKWFLDKEAAGLIRR